MDELDKLKRNTTILKELQDKLRYIRKDIDYIIKIKAAVGERLT